MLTQNAKQLTDRIKAYNPAIDGGLMARAWDFAEHAHRGQVRASGEPYFTHPVAVAYILADMHLDPATIITALLHDVVEDTAITLDMIGGQFTSEIADLVDGVTKLTRIETQGDNRQAENLRKLVLAMSEDIRVLLVKLADRTHNMRTIDSIPKPEKRERIAQETLSIFAPLAERIGMTPFQLELEDRAFAILQPAMRQSIISRLEFLSAQSEDVISRICEELHQVLQDAGIECSVSGRRKTAYSIWNKMQRKNVAIEELSDIMAFRIILAETAQCYQALGVIHGHYPMVMGRFKDYISTPKRNGYRSLHTGIIGPLRKRIELQIRTAEMHDVAERGVAAHWSYKMNGSAARHRDEVKRFKWLRDLVSILDNADHADEFLEHTQMEMYADQVFCFTPKGMVIALPKNATAVDFAYAVHSDIGNSCIGVRINGRLRQLATVLNNGDQVQILNDPAATPRLEWESFVVTGRARSAIRRFMRGKRHEEFARLGKALLQKAFRHHGKSMRGKVLSGCFNHYGINRNDALYALIGEGGVKPDEVLERLFPDLSGKLASEARKQQNLPAEKEKRRDVLNIKGLIAGMAVHLGRCCHPLPGERIIGIVTAGKGITVHRVDCQTLQKFSDMPELWLDIAWGNDGQNAVTVRLEAVLANEPGSLAAVATIIGQNDGNITNIQILSRTPAFFTFEIDLEVKNVRHMTAIMAALHASPYLESVKRADS